MADLNYYVSSSGKTVKLHEIRDRVRQADDAELCAILDDCARELLDLRTQAMLQSVPNPMRINHVRKLIARVKTEQTARKHKATALLFDAKWGNKTQPIMPAPESTLKDFQNHLARRRDEIISFSSQKLDARASEVVKQLATEEEKNTGENVRSLVEDLSKFND